MTRFEFAGRRHGQVASRGFRILGVDFYRRATTQRVHPWYVRTKVEFGIKFRCVRICVARTRKVSLLDYNWPGPRTFAGKRLPLDYPFNGTKVPPVAGWTDWKE